MERPVEAIRDRVATPISDVATHNEVLPADQPGSGEVLGRLEKGGTGLLVEGQVWGWPVGCLVDTGATVNILSLSWWTTHGEKGELQGSAEKVYSVDGRPMQLHGRVRTGITLGRETWPITFEIADVGSEAILGSTFLRDSRFMVDCGRGKATLGTGSDRR